MALLEFKQAYEKLKKEWTLSGDDSLNNLNSAVLYPFGPIDFDELKIPEWVSSSVEELTKEMPDEVLNHRCVECTSLYWDGGAKAFRCNDLSYAERMNNTECRNNEIMMVTFDRNSIMAFLRRMDAGRYFAKTPEELKRLTNMQLYLLYDAYLNKQYGGK